MFGKTCVLKKHAHNILQSSPMIKTFSQRSPMFIVFPKVPLQVPKYRSYMNLDIYVVPPLMHINYLYNMTYWTYKMLYYEHHSRSMEGTQHYKVMLTGNAWNCQDVI